MIIDGKKTCTKCGENKVAEEEFYKCKSKKDGYLSRCKECHSAAQKARNATPEGKAARATTTKKYRQSPEGRAVQKKCKQTPESKVVQKKYTQTPQYRAYQREYQKRRRAEEPLYRLQHNFTRSLNHARKKGGFSKTSRSAQILGCTWAEFMDHLAKRFWDGMTRENQGENGWEMDHIIPKATIKTEEDFIKLNHYTNFQPLWWDDNIKKFNNPNYDLRQSVHPLPPWLKADKAAA